MKHTLEKYGMRKQAEAFPMMIVLSFSYVCNAKCPNCPYNNSKIRKTYKDAKYMSWDVFKRIADEAGKYGAILRLSGGGEPMLHPNIYDCVRYAKERGCKVSMITNGSINVSMLINLADIIEFSVDAGNKEDYAKARIGLDWITLNTNVLQACSVPNRKTRIIASIINQEGINIAGAEKYWNKIVDKVQIRKYLTWGYNQNKSADESPYLPSGEPCPWLFERLNIDSRGDVTYCGEDIAFKHKFANIMDTPIKNIWLGKEFQAIRKKHLNHKGGELPMCAACPDWKYRSWQYNYWRLIKDADKHITA